MQYLILSALSSFPKACADTERGPPHDGDPVPAGGCGFRAGQSVFLHLQRTQGSIPEHQRAQGTLSVELHRWYVRVGMSQMMHHFVSCPFPDLPAPLSVCSSVWCPGCSVLPGSCQTPQSDRASGKL